jgi:prepilin-type N-terminal cleavage/methylation domain-containing protein
MRRLRAFTLVEVLIVVVILGILSAVVVPQFGTATDEAAKTATRDQLNKLREAIAIFHVRNDNILPNIQEGNGTWGELVSMGSDYLKFPPKNLWVPPAASKVIIFRDTPDTAYQTAYGWIYDDATGNLWAASFDDQDEPFPKP